MLRSQGTAGVAGVDDADRFDEHRVNLTVRNRAVLDAARDDEQLSGAERVTAPSGSLMISVPEITRNNSSVSSWECPTELTLDLDQLHLIVVHPRDDLR